PYVFDSLRQHRFVIGQLSKRAVKSRYRGTLLGVLWSLITPMVMLTIYTFVFGMVFDVRWTEKGASNPEFAAIIFSGMIVHSIFAECLQLAPTLITSNPQYVKKIVFPLEALPWVTLSTAFFQGLFSAAILIAYLLFLGGGVSPYIVLVPIPFLALVPFCLGVGWLASSAAVYVKDIGQVTGLTSTILFFLAPILYPKSALPDVFQYLIYLNPITVVIEESRKVLLWGEMLNWTALGIYFVFGLAFAWVSLVWFQKTRRGFADVL
ncbi:MAG: ABC transporter permease, partial [Gammaproteobacteria bacterium]